MRDRMFEVAYFWRMPPSAVLALSLSDYELHEAQAVRLAEKRREAQEG